jgi:hypothetical protein
LAAARQRFERDLVRRIAVLKCWETRWAFDPGVFLSGLPDGRYDWLDIRRLVRRGGTISPDEIIRGVQRGYAFLTQVTDDETLLCNDPLGRERQAYRRLVDSLMSGAL